MREQIDWGNAPEGATHRGAINWFKSDGEKVYTFDGAVWHPVSWEIWQLAPFAKRPSIHADEWSGEGLPPVGVVCHFLRLDDCQKETLEDGAHVKIIAHYDGMNGQRVAAFTYDHRHGRDVESAISECFRHIRPIRTTEQIAADERESAIKRACSDIEKQVEGFNVQLSYSVAIRATIEAMIDAGYRKP